MIVQKMTIYDENNDNDYCGHKKSSEGGIRTLDTTGMNRVL